LSETDEIEQCIRKYREYSDSVTILVSIYDLFNKNKELGRYIGIEHNLYRSDGRPVQPDFVAIYDDDRKGLLFELKWSLPERPDWIVEDIRDLKKYYDILTGWKNSTGKVEYQDVVLICNILDIKKIMPLLEILSNNEEFSFLKSEHFAVLGWTILASKQKESEEELRIEKCYGKTGDIKLEELLSEPAGILISKDVLKFKRWRFFFIKQKPPISYIIVVLIQHILNSFPPDVYQKSYEVHIDNILERSLIFFPSWNDYDGETKQIKRKWIIEALNMMVRIGIIKKISKDIYEVPNPIYKKRIPLQEALCKDIIRLIRKQEKPGKLKKVKRIKENKGIKTGLLTDYFKKV
jgi:hypothetical protein